jgi:hypothetical protein
LHSYQVVSSGQQDAESAVIWSRICHTVWCRVITCVVCFVGPSPVG